MRAKNTVLTGNKIVNTGEIHSCKWYKSENIGTRI